MPGRLLLIHQCPNLNVPSFRKSSCSPRPGSQPFLRLLPPQLLPFDIQDLEQLASQKRISADSQRARGTGMGYISHLGLSSEIPYVTIGWSLRLPETWSFPLNIPRFFHHSSDSSVQHAFNVHIWYARPYGNDPDYPSVSMCWAPTVCPVLQR